MVSIIASVVCIGIIFLLHLRKCEYIQAKFLQERDEMLERFDESIGKIIGTEKKKRHEVEADNIALKVELKNLKLELNETLEQSSISNLTLKDCKEVSATMESRYETVRTLNTEQAETIAELRQSVERYKRIVGEIGGLLVGID